MDFDKSCSCSYDVHTHRFENPKMFLFTRPEVCVFWAMLLARARIAKDTLLESNSYSVQTRPSENLENG